jgi:B9 domain-containing protein 2
MSDDEQKSGSAALRKARSRRKNRRKPEKEESNDSDSGNDSDSNLLGRSRGDELKAMASISEEGGRTMSSSIKPPPSRPRGKLRSIGRRRMEVAEKQPEVHIIGEIVGGTGFENGVSVSFEVDYNNDHWDLLDGDVRGKSHVDYPMDDGFSVWAHPIDVHFSCRSLQGWPRILFTVWKLDTFGTSDLAGYGFVHVPTSPGCHTVECNTWRPIGSSSEEWKSFYLGGLPRLRKTSLDVRYAKAWEQRCHLTTVASGKIHVQLDVILKHFGEEGVEWLP